MTVSDPTFRNYTPEQAASYAANRGSYSRSLYEHVLQYHRTHGNGQFDVLLDIGCGTGGATRGLASSFGQATGLDPGAEMVSQAAQIGGKTSSGKEIRYEVAAAEELDIARTVVAGSVDLISSGMAAHWFTMKDFWPKAAKMLSSGGSVALWTKSSLYCHPSTPNAAAVQRVLSHLEDVILGPYELPSNHLSRTMYDELTLPWDLSPPLSDFRQEKFVRKEWNRNGQLEPGQADFFGGSQELTLSQLAQSLGTASMVTRWREAHPSLVGTDKDCVNVTMRNVATALGAEVEHSDQVKLRVGHSTALLLFSRR